VICVTLICTHGFSVLKVTGDANMARNEDIKHSNTTERQVKCWDYGNKPPSQPVDTLVFPCPCWDGVVKGMN
jgi:hypothetical protein